MTTEKLLLGIDIGTSGLKLGVFNVAGQLLFDRTIGYDTSFYPNNKVEQDAEDWWKALCEGTKTLFNVHPEWIDRVAVVSFSGQMMGCLPVDIAGNPLRPSMIWSDQRANKEADYIATVVGNNDLYERTGQIAAASFTAAKILWLKDNEPDTYSRTFKVLNSKDFIVSRLTGEFVTDPCDASGTNLFNLEKNEWDQEILSKIGIDDIILPQIVPSTKVVGLVTNEAAEATGLLAGTPVVIGGGDGSVAALGAGMVKEGDAYISLGTSAWFSLVTTKPVYDHNHLRTTIEAHVIPSLFCPNGTTFNGSEPLKWLKENVFSSEHENISYDDITQWAESSRPGANNLLFLPYLKGEKCPYIDAQAKGVLFGLSPNHTKADIARAVLEGCAFNLRVIYDCFLEQGVTISKLRMVGGGASNDLWLSIFADIFNMKIEVPKSQDSSAALGAAILGGVGIGLFPDFSVSKHFVEVEKEVLPSEKNVGVYKRQLKMFKLLYEQVQPLFKEFATYSNEVERK